MAVLALEQLAPTNINRKLGVVMDERYRTHRVKEQPNPNIKDLNCFHGVIPKHFCSLI